MLPAWMYHHGPGHLADAVSTVTTVPVVIILLGLLVVVVGAGVGYADILHVITRVAADGARVTVVGVDTCIEEKCVSLGS